jgi:hypothetical protein
MSVALNLDVAMQMSSVLVAGRGCTCCAPRLAVGLRRALSRRGRRAVGVSSQQSSYLPTRVTIAPTGPNIFYSVSPTAAHLTRSQTPSRHLPCCFHRHAWNVPWLVAPASAVC